MKIILSYLNSSSWIFGSVEFSWVLLVTIIYSFYVFYRQSRCTSASGISETLFANHYWSGRSYTIPEKWSCSRRGQSNKRSFVVGSRGAYLPGNDCTLSAFHSSQSNANFANIVLTVNKFNNEQKQTFNN